MGLDAAYWKVQVPDGRLFADPQPSPDETSFQVDNTSEAYYKSVYFERHKNDLQPVPAPRDVQPTDRSRRRTRRATSCSRRSTRRRSSSTLSAIPAPRRSTRTSQPAQAIANEASVADAMAGRCHATADRPARCSFLHLGDVVYNFGEGQYYYDQFYEPFRNYDRPIFAIPGNHDGMVFGDTPDVPNIPTLTAFLRNFCADTPGPAQDAAGLVRSTMNQPGVYFTLDAPLRLDRRPLHERPRRPRRHLLAGRPLPDQRRPTRTSSRPS